MNVIEASDKLMKVNLAQDEVEIHLETITATLRWNHVTRNIDCYGHGLNNHIYLIEIKDLYAPVILVRNNRIILFSCDFDSDISVEYRVHLIDITESKDPNMLQSDGIYIPLRNMNFTFSLEEDAENNRYYFRNKDKKTAVITLDPEEKIEEIFKDWLKPKEEQEDVSESARVA